MSSGLVRNALAPWSSSRSIRAGLASALRITIGTRAVLGSARRRRRTSWLIQAGQLLALVLGLLAPRRLPAATLPGWIWPVGAAVMVLGAALRVWSLRALGRGFSRDVQVTQDQQLVTGGPYRWLRHPSYTGALLLFLGLGIAQANALSILVLTVLPVTVYLWRIRVEEAALAAVLGDRYQTFAAGRARLVPWLY